MYQSANGGRLSLIKTVTKQLKLRRWTVSKATHFKYDLSISSGNISFSVKILDESVITFTDLGLLIENMENETVSLKVQNHPALVFICNFGMSESIMASLHRRGVSVVNLNELHLISDLPIVETTLPYDLSDREVLLLRRQWKACLLISDRFKAIGDLENAIKWARRATEGTVGLVVAQRRLIELLLTSDRVDEAELVVTEALKLKPKEPGLLRCMISVATKRRDPAAIESWTGRLKSAMVDEALPSILSKTSARPVNAGLVPMQPNDGVAPLSIDKTTMHDVVRYVARLLFGRP